MPEGDEQFRRVAVQLGPHDSDGSQQVISGLKPNDQVVPNALQFPARSEE